MPRFPTALGIAVALLATPAGAQSIESQMVYRCRTMLGNIGGNSGALTLYRSFFEDGSTESMSVQWEDYSGSFVRTRTPGDQAMASMNWPGGPRSTTPATSFDWSGGSVGVTVLNRSINAPSKQELWRQIVVDRDHSVQVVMDKGARYLFSDQPSMRLTSLRGVTSGGGFGMPIASLLAWGSGVSELTVYETFVGRRQYRRYETQASPVGLMRIVAEYGIDVAAVARKAEQIREAATPWFAGLGDFRAKCERGILEDENSILVT